VGSIPSAGKKDIDHNLKSDKEPQFFLGLFYTIFANSDTKILKTRKKTNFFEIGQLTMSDLKKIKWEAPDLTNTGKTVTKTLNYRGISGNQREKTHGNSGPTPVTRGGAGAKHFSAGRAPKTAPLHLGLDRESIQFEGKKGRKPDMQMCWCGDMKIKT